MKKRIKTPFIEISVGTVLAAVWRRMDDHERTKIKRLVASKLTYHKYKQEDKDKGESKEITGPSSLTWRDGV